MGSLPLRHRAGEQAARLVGEAVEAVADDHLVVRLRQVQAQGVGPQLPRAPRPSAQSTGDAVQTRPVPCSA